MVKTNDGGGNEETGEQEAKRPRRKVPPIRVWVTDNERLVIAERAAETGLSLSSYVLALTLNRPIHSHYDLRSAETVACRKAWRRRAAGRC